MGPPACWYVGGKGENARNMYSREKERERERKAKKRRKRACTQAHTIVQTINQVPLTSAVEEGGRAKVVEAVKARAPALLPASAASEVIARYACRMSARCIRCVRWQQGTSKTISKGVMGTGMKAGKIFFLKRYGAAYLADAVWSMFPPSGEK